MTRRYAFAETTLRALYKQAARIGVQPEALAADLLARHAPDVLAEVARGLIGTTPDRRSEQENADPNAIMSEPPDGSTSSVAELPADLNHPHGR